MSRPAGRISVHVVFDLRPQKTQCDAMTLPRAPGAVLHDGLSGFESNGTYSNYHALHPVRRQHSELNVLLYDSRGTHDIDSNVRPARFFFLSSRTTLHCIWAGVMMSLGASVVSMRVVTSPLPWAMQGVTPLVVVTGLSQALSRWEQVGPRPLACIFEGRGIWVVTFLLMYMYATMYPTDGTYFILVLWVDFWLWIVGHGAIRPSAHSGCHVISCSEVPREICLEYSKWPSVHMSLGGEQEFVNPFL